MHLVAPLMMETAQQSSCPSPMENFLDANAFPENQTTTDGILQIITYYLFHFTHIFVCY